MEGLRGQGKGRRSEEEGERSRAEGDTVFAHLGLIFLGIRQEDLREMMV